LQTKQPDFANLTGIPEYSFGPIDLVPAIFVDNTTDDTTLFMKYTLKIDEMTIKNTEEFINKTISADLLILLVLAFKVSADVDVPSSHSRAEETKKGNAKLALKNLFPELGNSDILGRTSDGNGEVDDILKQIEWIKISAKKPKNDIFVDDVTILVTAYDEISSNGRPYGDKSYIGSFTLGKKDSSLMIKKSELPNPFIPQFQITLGKNYKERNPYDERVPDKTGDFGLLKIKRQIPGKFPEFDFLLTIEAQLNIDYPVKF
jgi:hypothetical protein